MDIEQKDNAFKISIPLISDEEMRNINNNFDSIVKEFTKQYIDKKDLALAQYIIKKQRIELEKKDKYIDFYKKGLEREIESNRENVLELIGQDNLLKKKDKIIKLMAKFIGEEDTTETFCGEKTMCDEDCAKCVIEYFTKKVEGK